MHYELCIMNYVDVLLPVPLDGLFTYSVPPEMEASAERGRRVLVPFGRNKTHVGQAHNGRCANRH